jgi:uncharacterized protein YjbI with pentapeptide repeats
LVLTNDEAAPMADDEEHVAQLRKGVLAWNTWRIENQDIRPNLTMASLRGADLGRVSLAESPEQNLQHVYRRFYRRVTGLNLDEANLREAKLRAADLRGADLTGADLRGADLLMANLSRANLNEAKLYGAILRGANLAAAILRGANLGGADLIEADLRGADLTGADLRGADLLMANLSRADLTGAILDRATLVDTDLTDADLTGCRIYGVSAWGLKLDGAKQQNLIITPENEPEITVDNIEVAQFIYLLLHNEKIRDVIDTIGKKGVLLLGRFTGEGRIVVLERLKEKLRALGYVPMVFNFDKPETKDFTETVRLLHGAPGGCSVFATCLLLRRRSLVALVLPQSAVRRPVPSQQVRRPVPSQQVRRPVPSQQVRRPVPSRCGRSTHCCVNRAFVAIGSLAPHT